MPAGEEKGGGMSRRGEEGGVLGEERNLGVRREI